MADTAFQTQYRDEFIAGFEQRQSLVRGTVTTEAEVKGNSAVFLVADSGSATVRTVRQALRATRNKVVIAGGVMTVYKENDSTVAWTAVVTTTPGDPLTAIDPA